jgi:uncharacterized protein
MIEPVKLLLVFVNESDMWHEAPLYQALVSRLQQLNLAGATAHVGVLGFGQHLRLHRKGLFGIADDRPVTITAVDDAPKIRSVLPEVREMVREGLILLLDAELIANRASQG